VYARNPSGGGKEQTSIALRLLTTAIGFSQQMRSQQIDFPLSPVLRAATEKCLTILEKCRIRLELLAATGGEAAPSGAGIP
jgi:hypothetical protein